MGYNYAFEGFNKEVMARAQNTNANISLKKSTELARVLRGQSVKRALIYLDEVIGLKKAVPYVRYYQEMAHQKGRGIATGGFPVHVAIEFKRLINLAVKNAKDTEIGEDLFLRSISVRQGNGAWKPGRYMGRKAKKTNVEVILEVKND